MICRHACRAAHPLTPPHLMMCGCSRLLSEATSLSYSLFRTSCTCVGPKKGEEVVWEV